MSTVVQSSPPSTRYRLDHLGWDDKRGTGGMICTIATEASLFIMLFFSYFFLAKDSWLWPHEQPPKLPLALTMLAILLASSVVLSWGERQLKQHQFGRARLSILITIGLGVVFLAVQVLEYKDHLKTLTPRTNAYGSIFYTITSFHAAHVIGGLIILAYVAALPHLEPVDRPPYRPFRNAALYWHFVDAVWVCVVALLYVAPNLR